MNPEKQFVNSAQTIVNEVSSPFNKDPLGRPQLIFMLRSPYVLRARFWEYAISQEGKRARRRAKRVQKKMLYHKKENEHVGARSASRKNAISQEGKRPRRRAKRIGKKLHHKEENKRKMRNTRLANRLVCGGRNFA